MSEKDVSKKLLRWFSRHGRDLPWRHTRDPYRIWVSEIMLQQTQVDRVVGYYNRFLKKFPDVHRLAQATWPQVLSIWRGLGYYRRARNMLRAAKEISTHFNGIFPHTIEELEHLPGIGPYTARAIAVFAFHDDVLALDTNTRRVLSRIFGFTGKNISKLLAERTVELVPQGKAWEFHQGLMDFGAKVCTAKHPQCSSCPMNAFCRSVVVKPPTPPSLRSKAISTASTRTPPQRFTTVEVAVGIIHRQGKILITRRPQGTHLAGFWEFPGGKREDSESWRSCLKRELKEELGIEVAVRPHDWSEEYTYNHRRVNLRFHRCSILKGRPKAYDGQEIRWIRPSELISYRFPPANERIIRHVASARFIDPHTEVKG